MAPVTKKSSRVHFSKPTVPGEFSFGVEIEILVKPKMASTKFTGWLKKRGFEVSCPSQENAEVPPENVRTELQQRLNRTALRETLAWALSDKGVKARQGGEKDDADYNVWSVMEEMSLNEPTGFWRVEFVSKIQSTTSIGTSWSWMKDIDKVFEVITDNCYTHSTTGCSMHVHVSPGENIKFSDEELQKVCKAICYFDYAITQVVPEHRKENDWASSNCAGTGSSVNKDLVAHYQDVLKKGWKAALFNAYLTKANCARENVYHKMSKVPSNPKQRKAGRYVSWNFQHATDPCGTIEFRRPPGVATAKAALHWIAFTLGFVSQALLTNWDDKKFDSKPDSISQVDYIALSAFIRAGLLAIPSIKASDLNNAEDLGLATLSKIDNGPLAKTTQEINQEKATRAWILRMQEKKAKLGEDHSNFASKANSRVSTPVLGPQDTNGDVDMESVVKRLDRLKLR